jgi:HK97 family phage portal protein
MGRWFGPSTTRVDDAMRLSAVFACLRLLSEAISTLPIDTFIRSNGARRAYRPRPDYLNFGQPGLSRIDYFSQVMLSLLTDGNAYVLTPRRADGTVIELVVLDPSRMVVEKHHGQLRYTCNNVPLDPVRDLMHIKGMCLPGHIVGISPIAYAAETVGVGLNAQRYGSSFFDNGAVPSVAISSPNKLEKDVARRWADEWNASHQGTSNAHKVAVLSGGATMSAVSITPEDAQFLQTRQFTVPDVARVYGVPPHLIADASNSTSWGTGLSEQNIAFGQFSLRPWTERIEEAHGRLLTLDGLPDVFLKLNMDAVLRASLSDRYESYKIAIDSEFMTPNEARRFEDMAPVPWGDVPPPTVRREAVGPLDSNVQPATGKPKPEPPPTSTGVGQ